MEIELVTFVVNGYDNLTNPQDITRKKAEVFLTVVFWSQSKLDT